MTTPERPQDCPICGNYYLTARHDIFKDGRPFIFCDCCAAMAELRLWNQAKPLPNRKYERAQMNQHDFNSLYKQTFSAIPAGVEAAARWWAAALDERFAHRREAFYIALVAVALANRAEDPGCSLRFDTDYDLDDNLSRAALAAGFTAEEIRSNHRMMPYKCSVLITGAGLARVYAGYGAGWRDLS